MQSNPKNLRSFVPSCESHSPDRESSARPKLVRRSLSEGGTPAPNPHNLRAFVPSCEPPIRYPSTLTANLTLLTLICFLFISCKESSQKPPSITQTHTTAETSLTLTLSTTTLPTSGILTATLSAEHPQSAHIEFPSTTANFGDFTVFESSDTPPALNTAGKITTARTYTLEPDLPGTSTLPSLKTVILPDSSTPTEILTDPVSIEITSVLTDGETKSSDIVTDPDQPYVQSYSFRVPAPFLVIVLLLIPIGAYFIAKRCSKPDPPEIIGDDAFSQLKLATPAEVLSQVESAFTRSYAQKYHLSLQTYDFQGLLAALDNPSQTLLGTIDQFERFQYSPSSPLDRDVWKIYHFLTFILNEEAP